MLSQQELADRAGVSLFTVQRIERGEGSARPKTGRAIAGALGVGVEDLLGKAQAPSSQRSLFNGLEEERRQHRLQLLHDLKDYVRDLVDRYKSDAARFGAQGTLEDWGRLERNSSFACIGVLSVLRDESGAPEGLASEAERQAWRLADQAAENLNALCDEIEDRTEAMRKDDGQGEGISFLSAYRKRAG